MLLRNEAPCLIIKLCDAESKWSEEPFLRLFLVMEFCFLCHCTVKFLWVFRRAYVCVCVYAFYVMIMYVRASKLA